LKSQVNLVISNYLIEGIFPTTFMFGVTSKFSKFAKSYNQIGNR